MQKLLTLQPLSKPTDPLNQPFTELGWITAGLIHDISSPLTAALLLTDDAKLDPKLSLQYIRKSLQSIHAYIETARTRIRSDGQIKTFDSIQYVQAAVRLLRPLARSAGVTLIFDTAESFTIYGEPVKFQSIVANLIVNGIEACSYTSTGQRFVSLRLAEESGIIILTVSDTGKGIDPQNIQAIFEPFYSSKQRGLGIGLALISEYITRDFKGQISVMSNVGKGTTFTVKLPAMHELALLP